MIVEPPQGGEQNPGYRLSAVRWTTPVHGRSTRECGVGKRIGSEAEFSGVTPGRAPGKRD